MTISFFWNGPSGVSETACLMMELVAHVLMPQPLLISAANMWYVPSEASLTTEPPHDVVLLKRDGGGYAAAVDAAGARFKTEQDGPFHCGSHAHVLALLPPASPPALLQTPFKLQSASVVHAYATAVAALVAALVAVTAGKAEGGGGCVIALELGVVDTALSPGSFNGCTSVNVWSAPGQPVLPPQPGLPTPVIK